LEQHLPCLDVHPNYFAEFTTHDNQFMYIIYIWIYVVQEWYAYIRCNP
jgi:hypothetical protein